MYLKYFVMGFGLRKSKEKWNNQKYCQNRSEREIRPEIRQSVILTEIDLPNATDWDVLRSEDSIPCGILSVFLQNKHSTPPIDLENVQEHLDLQ